MAASDELERTEWDLEPLLGERGVDDLLEEATAEAREFATSHAGKISSYDAADLARAMHELERIYDRVGRASSYASLRFATDTADPARGALLQRVQERATEIETRVLFFELEWAGVPDERAAELLADERARLRAPLPGYGAPLSAPPAERARGAVDDREGGHRPRRLVAPVL